MARLWSLLTNELGQGFRSQFGEEGGESFRYWAKQLESYSEQQIFRAVERWVYSDEKFINVKILRSLCQPTAEDLGIMSFEQAHPLICKREWEKLHPAFQHVARKYDLYNIARMTVENSAKALRPLFSEVVDRLARGEPFERLEVISANPSGTSHMAPAEARIAGKKGRNEIKGLLRELKGQEMVSSS